MLDVTTMMRPLVSRIAGVATLNHLSQRQSYSERPQITAPDSCICRTHLLRVCSTTHLHPWLRVIRQRSARDQSQSGKASMCQCPRLSNTETASALAITMSSLPKRLVVTLTILMLHTAMQYVHSSSSTVALRTNQSNLNLVELSSPRKLIRTCGLQRESPSAKFSRRNKG